jgi:hypothetical protein
MKKKRKTSEPTELPLGEIPGTAEMWEAVSLDLQTFDALRDLPLDGWLTVCLTSEGQPVAIEAHAEPDGGAAVVAAGCAAPASGLPRLPRRIDAEPPLADALRARFADVDVEVHTIARAELARGAAAEIIAGLTSPALPDGTYADAGVPAPVARALFDAARAFHQARPWRVLGDDIPLEVEAPDHASMYAAIMGTGSETFGLALFDSGADLFDPDRVEELDPLQIPSLSLTFGPRDAVPPALAAEAHAAKWPLAGPQAFPLAVRTGDDETPVRYVNGAEAELLVLALRAVTAFCGRHARALRAGDDVAGGEAVLSATGERVIVRLRTFDDDELPDGDVEDAQPRTDPFDGDGAPADPPRGSFLPEMGRLHGMTAKLPGSKATAGRLRWSFFLAAEPDYMPNEDAFEEAMFRFLEWAMFTAPLPPAGQTLARRAIDEARDLTAAERARLHTIAQPRYGVFVIEEIEPNSGMTLRDVASDARFSVRERRMTARLERGNVLLGPLFPDGDGLFVLGGSCVSIPEFDADGLKSLVPDAGNDDFAPALEQAVFGASTDWIMDIDSLADLRHAYEDFAGALAATGTRLPGIARLQQMVREHESPLDVTRIAGNVQWWNKTEPLLFFGMLQRLWNLTPRPDLEGSSPEEAHKRAKPKGRGKRRRR